VQASEGTLQVELVNTAVNGLDGDLIIANYRASGTVNGEAIDEHNGCLIKLDDGPVSDDRLLRRPRNSRTPVELTSITESFG
jgi:hypothetical protein